jgi:hypothetical protein
MKCLEQVTDRIYSDSSRLSFEMILLLYLLFLLVLFFSSGDLIAGYSGGGTAMVVGSTTTAGISNRDEIDLTIADANPSFMFLEEIFSKLSTVLSYLS